MALLSDDFSACNLNAWTDTGNAKTRMSCYLYKLKVYSLSTSYDFDEIYRTWTAISEEIKAVFDWEIISFKGDCAFIRILDASGNSIIYLGYDATDLRYLSDGSWYDVSTFDPDTGQTYELDIRIRPSTKKFDIYIDSVKKVDNVAWGNISAGNPNQFRFCSQTGTSTSRYYADNLVVETVAAPAGQPYISRVQRVTGMRTWGGISSFCKRFPALKPRKVV